MLLAIAPIREPSFHRVIFKLPAIPAACQVISCGEPISQFSPPLGDVTVIEG